MSSTDNPKLPEKRDSVNSLSEVFKDACVRVPLSEHLRRHLEQLESTKTLSLPVMPRNEPVRPLKLPTAEEANHYQSAAILLRRLAESVGQWRKQLPDDFQPTVLALLNGGVQVQVDRLAQESFHGIRIDGSVEGAACVVLAHQATVQLLCFAQPVRPPEQPRRPIGFIIDGEPSEA